MKQISFSITCFTLLQKAEGSGYPIHCAGYILCLMGFSITIIFYHDMNSSPFSWEASIPGRLWILKVKGPTNRGDFFEVLYQS